MPVLRFLIVLLYFPIASIKLVWRELSDDWEMIKEYIRHG
jgi:hypothetical protein